jgi:hypothetical protein
MSDKTILLLIFIPLLIGVLFEVVILGIAFFGADEVDCNLLWCEFKTSKRTIENNTIISSNSVISSNSECYQNGIKINCSEMPDVNSIIQKSLGDING